MNMEMKKTFRWMMGAVALVGAVIVTSCSEDDPDPDTDPDNGFVVDREDLKGEITEGEIVLESGTYNLTGALVVKEVAKLLIKPGLTVEPTEVAEDHIHKARYTGFSRGVKFNVQGIVRSPVLFL